MDDVQTRTLDAAGGQLRWTRIFLFLAAALSGTILLKVGEVQYLELIYFVQLCLLVAVFVRDGFRVRFYRPTFRLCVLYLCFIAVALISAFAALRNDFYFPSEISLLKHPILITLSRIGELMIDLAGMVYLVHLFRADIDNLIFALRTYFWVGVLGSVYSLLTFPINFIYGLQLGTYSDLHRMRGFYNEGGPYGIYMISEVLVGLILYRQRWIKGTRFRLGMALSFIALVGSQSKAAIFAVVAMFLFNTVMVERMFYRFLTLTVMAVVIGIALHVPSVSDSLKGYLEAPEQFEYLSHFSSEDPNFILGRVAGSFLVPRMIAAHPYLGVGWGNYGLVRDSPEYRGAAAFADNDDIPSLGLFGTAAEIGVPATLFLIAILFYPYFYLRRIGAPLLLKNLALMQPVVHLFGGQLNLTYPWIVTAFALGLGYFIRWHGLDSKVPNDPPDGSPSPVKPSPVQAGQAVSSW